MESGPGCKVSLSLPAVYLKGSAATSLDLSCLTREWIITQSHQIFKLEGFSVHHPIEVTQQPFEAGSVY